VFMSGTTSLGRTMRPCRIPPQACGSRRCAPKIRGFPFQRAFLTRTPSLRRITTGYSPLNTPSLFTSYDAASGGNVVNQVKDEFNGLGQVTKEWQEHRGAVTGSSANVQYAYSEMAGGANHSRLTSMTYASGYVLNYNYGTGLDSTISRLTSLSDSGNTLESYSYLGLATIVKRAHAQSGVDLSYIKLTGESVGDAGDQYNGLDRF